MTDRDVPLRLPISAASRKGVSWLADESRNRRLVLTRFGRPTAVIDSEERLDADLQRIRAAAEAVIASAAETAASRTKTLDLDGVCARLGIDVEDVHKRAGELRSR